MASFSFRVKPEGLGDGATGSVVGVLLAVVEDGVEVGVRVVDEDLGVVDVENVDNDEDEAEGNGLLRVGLGKVVHSAPLPVDVALMLVKGSSVALGTRDSHADLAVLEASPGLVSVDWIVTDAGTSVGVA